MFHTLCSAHVSAPETSYELALISVPLSLSLLHGSVCSFSLPNGLRGGGERYAGPILKGKDGEEEREQEHGPN